MSARLLLQRSVADLLSRRGGAVTPEALAVAAPIVDAVRTRGEAALREYAERFGDVAAGGPLFLARPPPARALRAFPVSDPGRGERVAERIHRFVEAPKQAPE